MFVFGDVLDVVIIEKVLWLNFFDVIVCIVGMFFV